MEYGNRRLCNSCKKLKRSFFIPVFMRELPRNECCVCRRRLPRLRPKSNRRALRVHQGNQQAAAGRSENVPDEPPRTEPAPLQCPSEEVLGSRSHLDSCRSEPAPSPPRYECPLCGESCADAAGHVLCRPQEDERLGCKVCGEVFYEASTLESHERPCLLDLIENQFEKQAHAMLFAENNFVKKEPIEVITIGDSDDEND